MFDLALAIAEELDKSYNDNGTVKGPLHGLPVSLKDQFHVKGYDTSMGYVGWVGTYEGDPNPAKVHKIDSQVVKELVSLGAVLYCKVNLSQQNLIRIIESAILDQSAPNSFGTCFGSPLHSKSWPRAAHLKGMAT